MTIFYESVGRFGPFVLRKCGGRYQFIGEAYDRERLKKLILSDASPPIISELTGLWQSVRRLPADCLYGLITDDLITRHYCAVMSQC
jgi:hypothetical protein